MDFYQVVNNRRTVRELKAEPVPTDVLERIIAAGIQAPTYNHGREWEFVILREEEKENALQFVKAWSATQEEIISRAKKHCNLIWLENLNLRGSYKPVILDYIQRKYPSLFPLYQDIYTRNDRSYWEMLDAQIREYASKIGLDYVTNDDSMRRPFDAPPVIVNYFYHEQIRKSAQKEGTANA